MAQRVEHHPLDAAFAALQVANALHVPTGFGDHRDLIVVIL